MATLNLKRMMRQIALAAELQNEKSSVLGMLPTCSTGYYVNGILFERTGRQGSLYFWRVLTPCFHPTSSLVLNYSRRLNNGVTLDGSEQEIVAQAVSELVSTPGLLENLKRAITPAEFLEQQAIALAHPEARSAGIVFDLAMSAALDHRNTLAFDMIAHIRHRTSYDPEHRVRLCADELAEALMTGADLHVFAESVSAKNRLL